MKLKDILRHILTGSVIWLPFFPALILDIAIEIYHRICFPINKIPLVKRSNYIKMDRTQLKYLNWINKIDCWYCGYMNGLANYWTEIAARTENFYCPIKHKRRKGFKEPTHHKDFIEFGDEKTFKNKAHEKPPIS